MLCAAQAILMIGFTLDDVNDFQGMIESMGADMFQVRLLPYLSRFYCSVLGQDCRFRPAGACLCTVIPTVVHAPASGDPACASAAYTMPIKLQLWGQVHSEVSSSRHSVLQQAACCNQRAQVIPATQAMMEMTLESALNSVGVDYEEVCSVDPKR